jgi:hypothetical protein
VTDLFSEVRALVAAEPVQPGNRGVVEAYLHSLCAAAAHALPVAGAALHLLKGDNPFGLMISSDEASKLITELQVTLGEGPSADVWSSRRPVLEPDLAGRGMARWPAFAPAAMSLGARAVFAFPLQVGASRLGVLDINRSEAGSLTEQQLVLALTFAEVAVAALLDADQHLDGSPDGLDGALADQAVLYQAQGMVMVQLSVRLEEAAARLRGHAYASDKRLAEVARDVVARRLQLDRDGARPTDGELP